MTPFPRHVAVIMDGNGRWATERGLSRDEGHRRGAEAVRRVVRAADELGVQALTLYAFSVQNWERPRSEVGHLMRLLCTFVTEETPELLARGIRVVTIGDLRRLPPFARAPLAALVVASARNQAMTLCLALSYGGREALTAAARALAAEVASGRLRPEDVDERQVAARLDTSALPPLDLPDPNLGGAASVELPALGGSVRRASFHAGPLARLRARDPGNRPRRLRTPPAPLRPDGGSGGGETGSGLTEDGLSTVGWERGTMRPRSSAWSQPARRPSSRRRAWRRARPLRRRRAQPYLPASCRRCGRRDGGCDARPGRRWSVGCVCSWRGTLPASARPGTLGRLLASSLLYREPQRVGTVSK